MRHFALKQRRKFVRSSGEVSAGGAGASGPGEGVGVAERRLEGRWLHRVWVVRATVLGTRFTGKPPCTTLNQGAAFSVFDL